MSFRKMLTGISDFSSLSEFFLLTFKVVRKNLRSREQKGKEQAELG